MYGPRPVNVRAGGARRWRRPRPCIPLILAQTAASHAAFFPTFWGSAVAVVLVLWLLKLVMTRRFDRYFATMVGLFVASGLLSSYIAGTDLWIQFAQRITR